MSRLIVHMAVPGPKRGIAATMTGLSGNPEEFSVELDTIPGGVSDLWDEEAGYPRPGKYWGASQALAPEVCVGMQQSEAAPAADAWYTAFLEDTGQFYAGNTPTQPTDSSFEAFLAAIGCVKVIPEIL